MAGLSVNHGNGWFDLGKITDVELKPDPVSTGEFKLDTGAYKVGTVTVPTVTVPTVTVPNFNTIPIEPGDIISVTWDDNGETSGALLKSSGSYVESGQLKQPKQKKEKVSIEYNDPMRSISLKDEG